ncbi:hypothetical protein [Modestobacter lapidis]
MLAWVVAAAVLATGIVLLRAELMTVDVPQPEGSFTDVVVEAQVVQEEAAVHEEMTRGLVSTCRLLVNADVVQESFAQVGPQTFAFRLQPGLDEFDQRELRGCLRDTRVQHLLLDVRRLETVTPRDRDDRN